MTTDCVSLVSLRATCCHPHVCRDLPALGVQPPVCSLPYSAEDRRPCGRGMSGLLEACGLWVLGRTPLGCGPRALSGAHGRLWAGLTDFSAQLFLRASWQISSRTCVTTARCHPCETRGVRVQSETRCREVRRSGGPGAAGVHTPRKCAAQLRETEGPLGD